MAKIITAEYEMELQYPPFENMTDNEFRHFCEQNKHIRIERDENHQILFTPPVSTEGSFRNSDIIANLVFWNRKLKAGFIAESSAGFCLPDTSMRSPGAAWISIERWNALTEDRRKGSAYIVPDFLVELASPSDSIA